MKISIGMKLQPGPWGGGNRFGAALTDHLRRHGHAVSHDLAADDLDVIVLAEPDRKLRISAYDHADVLRYLLFVNRRALVVHRINNSSEARDDPQKHFNRYRLQANRVADHTVFVSRWLWECYREAGFEDRPHTVILNGADQRLWCPAPESRVGERVPLRIVTHHWSMNPNKGWSVYRQLDELLGRPPWSERVQFTYIGPLPEGVTLKHGRHVPPVTGSALVEALREHDLYITASLCEAGPNHVLEGALCGLPLLYRESGSMREYCAGFGLPYTPETLEAVLTRMIRERDQWASRMAGFPLTAERMCGEYVRLFETLVSQRPAILAQRRFGASWSWMVQTLLNRHRRVGTP
ncbi:MAG: hypothetical protein HQL99_01565 [Magnetococcales bacterium]|nr:hypothetical protein [Magnetococcales bacterium]